MLKIVKWLGTASACSGSYTLALGFNLAGYTLFLLGAVLWIFAAVKDKDWANLTMQGFFLGANIIGFSRAFWS